MTPPTIPPIGTLITSGNHYPRKVTPAWIAKRLRRHAKASERIAANQKAKTIVESMKQAA